VVAMLIVPPNAAYLLTDRLSWMLGLSVLIGVLSAVGGYALATLLDGSIAGAIAVVSGLLFGLAAVFSPTHGMLGAFLARRRTRREIRAALQPGKIEKAA
jgi:manganese/zinc/iron transport system permease protein